MKWTGIAVLVVIIITIGLAMYINFFLRPDTPKIANSAPLEWQRTMPEKDFYRVKNNWLKKSNSGLWEMYLEGAPYERGVSAGKLSYELQQYQEDVFVEQIHQIIPSDFYLRFLRYFIRVFNRNIDKYVPDEYKTEIYGYSQVMPKDYEYITNNYERILNYHAAHDIGHAMQNYALVGCTSFGAWDSHTTDSALLIGRNFDFWAGDKFSDNKIILFCKPDSGHKFMMVTWAGMIGCVSGMNDQGLTVTINAAKSDMPTGAAMPISLLAREILQYASTIQEADSIAAKRKTFVSETVMIGSAANHATGLIEKSPSNIGFVNADSSLMLCTNHYQSKTYSNDTNNLQNIRESASEYRYNRLQELLQQHAVLSPKDVAAILRDKKGLHDTEIGYGNEKAMDQMQGHHSIIFKPEARLVWVSTFPWQEGKYVCYDLNKFFSSQYNLASKQEITIDTLEIPADTFMQTEAFKGYVYFRETATIIRHVTTGKDKTVITNDMLNKFIHSNPNYYVAYEVAGNYKKHEKQYGEAAAYYQKALTLEINTKQERDNLGKLLREVEKKK